MYSHYPRSIISFSDNIGLGEAGSSASGHGSRAASSYGMIVPHFTGGNWPGKDDCNLSVDDRALKSEYADAMTSGSSIAHTSTDPALTLPLLRFSHLRLSFDFVIFVYFEITKTCLISSFRLDINQTPASGGNRVQKFHGLQYSHR